MKNIGLYIYTLLNGKFIGKDENGNKYYESNISHGSKKNKRWVIYKGIEDPTKINPYWHAWIHHIIDDVSDIKKKKFSWQKKLSPNLTGTKKAYKPAGHLLSEKKKYVNKKRYEAWDPNQKKD